MSKQKRADGRYAVQIYIGKDESGKRRYKTVYGETQKEANQKAAELKAQLGRGIDVTADRDTFEEWATLLLTSKKRKLSAAQYEINNYRLKYFVERFGKMPLKSVKPFLVDDALDELAERNPATGKPTAKKTLQSYAQICSQVFKFAIKNRVTDYNPVNDVSVTATVQSKKRRALSEEERQWIITADNSCRWKLPAMLAMLAGLRRGELTALTWNDIDLKNKTISITKSYDFKAKEIKAPKSEAGNRIVGIPDVLVEYLDAIKPVGIYVCTNKKGGLMSVESWERLCESMMTDLEIAHGTSGKKNKFAPEPTIFTINKFGWHELRHTYATILFEAGVDVLTAQHLLGHADPETTLKIYTHLENEQKSRSFAKLNAFLNPSCKSDASQAT